MQNSGTTWFKLYSSQQFRDFLSLIFIGTAPFFNNNCLCCLDQDNGVAKGFYDLTGVSKHLYPVLTIADGNCVPRALSILCFGDESHHVELRCRIVIELVLNCHDYLSLGENDLNILCQRSDFHSGNAEESTFHQEILHVCKSSTYMGIWQIMAAANALGVDILSVYPPLGPLLYRSFSSRTMSAKNKISSHVFTLFWSSIVEHSEDMPQEYWTANHVVPLLPPSYQ